jgi:hypothetical protein
MESSDMLSWRGGADGSAGVGRFLIMLLLDDVRIVPGASPETAFDQQPMQVKQRRPATRGAPIAISAQTTAFQGRPP